MPHASTTVVGIPETRRNAGWTTISRHGVGLPRMNQWEEPPQLLGGPCSLAGRMGQMECGNSLAPTQYTERLGRWPPSITTQRLLPSVPFHWYSPRSCAVDLASKSFLAGVARTAFGNCSSGLRVPKVYPSDLVFICYGLLSACFDAYSCQRDSGSESSFAVASFY